jgi:hypothetical protein
MLKKGQRPQLAGGKVASNVQLLVWDFAGQPGYYAAQRLFLGEVHPDQLVVVLCINVRSWRGDGLHNILKDWLSGLCRGQQSAVEMHGEQSKVALMVVATHCEMEDAYLEVQAMASELQAQLSTTAFAGRVSLLKDGDSEVWLRKKDDKRFSERLLVKMVEQSLAGCCQLVSAGAHKTLALVQSNQIRKGVTLIQAMGQPNPDLFRHLAQLHVNGLIYYQAGATAVCSDITAPLSVFKSLLREQYVRCSPVECVHVRRLWNSTVQLMIEHNEVWEEGAKEPRFTIRGAAVRPPVPELLVTPDGQPLEFIITPRDSWSMTLRFTNTVEGKAFVRCLEANRLMEPAYDFVITSTVVWDALVKLYRNDPAICMLLQNLLLSCGVLVRNRVLLDVEGRPKVDRLGNVVVEYLMPYLFPRLSNVVALNWRNYEIRHARKYVVDKMASQAQMQSVVLKLSAVMRGRAQTEHFWRDDEIDTLSVGAWQSSATRKCYFECRFEALPKRWAVYVLLAVGEQSEAGLVQMIVQRHDAVQQWFSSEFKSSVLPFMVARRPEMATPELIGQGIESDCGMMWKNDVHRDYKPEVAVLLPESMRELHRLSPAEQRTALCPWCTCWSGTSKKVQCQHSWTVAGRFVPTAFMGGGGQGKVLAGHDMSTRLPCAIKVCGLAAVKQELAAAARLKVRLCCLVAISDVGGKGCRVWSCTDDSSAGPQRAAPR